MKYLKRFNTLQQYVDFENNNKLFTPNVSSITTQGIVEYARDNILTFIALEAGSTVKLTKVGSPDNISLEYSVVPNEWHNYTIDTTITLEKKRDFVKFRGVNSTFSSMDLNNYYNFVMTGKIKAGGDVTSLLNNIGGDVEFITDYIFVSLFKDCESLIVAPNLPTMKLTRDCYDSMFTNCSNLTKAPSLPATTLADACYIEMFYGCISLTQAPALPATVLANGCYDSMFFACTSLVEAPELPATTLTESCYYQMFGECTSLVNAPALPATNLESWCYANMFKGCTSLIQAPTLPATALMNLCYSEMFVGCTSLISAPILPALSLISRCYICMFKNCVNLNYVKAMFTYPSNSDMETIGGINTITNWLENVSSTGTFVKNSNAAWQDSWVVPLGWTVITASE